MTNNSLSRKMKMHGLLRVHGRLEDIRTLPKDMRNPILLPRNHPLVYLLLQHMHETSRHCGYKRLMHEARRKFWIIGLCRMAKYLTNKCIVCQKLRKRPLGQIMGQIPILRVATRFPPFTNTAIDMFGPFHIKLSRKTLKEAQVIIFTCMTTRAVHLELVSDKSSDTFLLAFRRFASLRGHPNTCRSDWAIILLVLKVTWTRSCRIGTFRKFRVFFQMNLPANSSGDGIYRMRVIRME